MLHCSAGVAAHNLRQQLLSGWDEMLLILPRMICCISRLSRLSPGRGPRGSVHYRVFEPNPGCKQSGVRAEGLACMRRLVHLVLFPFCSVAIAHAVPHDRRCLQWAPGVSSSVAGAEAPQALPPNARTQKSRRSASASVVSRPVTSPMAVSSRRGTSLRLQSSKDMTVRGRPLFCYFCRWLRAYLARVAHACCVIECLPAGLVGSATPCIGLAIARSSGCNSSRWAAS